MKSMIVSCVQVCNHILQYSVSTALSNMRFSIACPSTLASLCCVMFYIPQLKRQKRRWPPSPSQSAPVKLSTSRCSSPSARSPYSAADVLAAARVIESGSFYSFNSTFYELAVGKMAVAEKAVVARNPVSEQKTYFAASNYFRCADFYLHGNWSDPLIDVSWVNQTECFN